VITKTAEIQEDRAPIIHVGGTAEPVPPPQGAPPKTRHPLGFGREPSIGIDAGRRAGSAIRVRASGPPPEQAA